ncbi:MAG: PKD domain-containing protein [Thermoplasmata archaeon]|nr:PKD domain-containing protein [Thermoplasmata archaeon]
MTPGTYTVNYSETDFFDVSGWGTWSITVAAPPAITASAIPAGTEPGGSVAFTSNLTLGSPPYSYVWNFGDGGTSTLTNPSHVYSTAGTYSVNVTGRDSVGGTASHLLAVTVDPKLTAHPSASRAAFDVGSSTMLSAGAAGGSGTYSTYAWTFGDGNTGNGASPTHTYAASGTYLARVNVTDTFGFVASGNLIITVNPVLTASPSATPASVATGSTVTFSAGASGGTGPIVYAWEFGDGGTGAVANPTHSYSHTGTFTVDVWVNDSAGGSIEKALSVTVTSPSGTGSSLPLGGSTWLYLLIAVIVVIAALAALIAMRRRKPASNMPPPSGSAPAPWSESPPPGQPPAGAR